MIILDTNSFIRFFTRDVESQALQVVELFESAEELAIPDVVFPEIEYVTKSQYRYTKEKIIELYEFMTTGRFRINAQIKTAIQIYKESNLDIADCIIAAYSLGNRLASFDRQLVKIKGVKGFWK